MDLDREPLPDGFRLRYQDAEPRVDPGGRRVQKGIEHQFAAVPGVLADPRAAQTQSASLPRVTLLYRLVLGMDGTHAGFDAGRAHHNLAARADRAREHGASDRCAMTGQGEAPVHGKAEPAFARPGDR